LHNQTNPLITVQLYLLISYLATYSHSLLLVYRKIIDQTRVNVSASYNIPAKRKSIIAGLGFSKNRFHLLNIVSPTSKKH
jgi:hypothetical protein